MKEGFLFSSFSAGFLPNEEAHEELKQAIFRTDAAYIGKPVEDLSKVDVVRLVFIPTAMYAPRPESKHSPSKQRQVARVNAHKRRQQLVQLLENTLDCTVHAITLDLSDGSIAQAYDETVTSETALSDWQPHVVYLSGGNTFWLHHCLDDDWTKRLQSCNAVYMGQSAGAIVAGQSIETACWKQWDDPRVVPQMETYDDLEDAQGLGLVGDYSLFPHMDTEWKGLVKEKREELDSKLKTIGEEEVYKMANEKLIVVDNPDGD